MSPARLLVSVEAAESVSTEEIERLEASVRARGYDCAECGERSSLDAEPAVVVMYDGGPLLGWARVVHQRCAPERSRPADLADLAARGTATVVAGLIPHASGDRAVILCELEDAITATSAAGDRVDLAAGWLIERGLHLVTTAGRRPPVASGWSLWLPSPAVAVVAGPGEIVLFQGEMVTPPGWVAVARSRGAELFAGVSGLRALGQGARYAGDRRRGAGWPAGRRHHHAGSPVVTAAGPARKVSIWKPS